MLSLPSSYGHVLNHTRIYIETVILCPCLETLLPSFYHLLPSNLTTATKLSPNQTLSFLFKLLLLNINMWHSACDDLCPPLSPPSPCFLHVAASRSCACWILLAPTHQLLTSPCPLEFHPPFSGTHWCLDTPAVGSLMMCCLPYAHNLDACGSGATVGRSPHH